MALCNLCPRRCNAMRGPDRGEGYCHMGTLPVVARAAAHLWEEPCISGTLVRHLILPLRTSESLRILDAIAEELPSSTPVSLMRQYTPMNGVNLPGLDRRLTAREYARVRDYMLALGLEGYLQSRESADSAFTPAFMDGESTRLFPSERADAEN